MSLAGLAWPVELRPHPKARAMRLRLDEVRERLTLTYPRKLSRHIVLEWARGQEEWVDAQLAQLRPGEPFRAGATILFEGREIRLHWEEGLPRAPRLEGNQLSSGGPEASFALRIERFLRIEALARLSAETANVAARAGVSIRSVAVGDASSRWGSCSASGAIRYSWRLILATPRLLRWVVAHEVAHRRHMDHGPAFRRLEAELYDGDVAAARAELRALGPRLKRIGRGL
ncbi:M48 family metallopeptidase [Sphingomonas sp. G124]|uniref:M48 family metallopeptidase n=1 Tax=Sphingomonas cremea TaxID=2904799 RepID=A0A9X1QMX9_9SPHN|nr:YgjP-like metallopeptidase domain-containing protein [Sphingomonas cremea]MCF2514952.1 M48 family metallopeptidase [Sphingomonas cremea]